VLGLSRVAWPTAIVPAAGQPTFTFVAGAGDLANASPFVSVYNIKGLLVALSSFMLNIEIVMPECLVPPSDVTYDDKLYAIFCLPLVLIALVGCFHCGSVIYHYFRGRRLRSGWSNSFVNTMLVILSFMYTYETRSALAVFDCSATAPPDGNFYLAGTPAMACFTTNTRWSNMALASAFAILVYTLAYPTIVFVVWALNRRLIIEDQLLRAKCTGDDRLTNPNALHLRQAFSRIYYQYQPDYSFWEVAVAGRKLLIILICTSVFDAGIQMVLVMFVLSASLGLHAYIRPYMCPSNYDAVLRSHAVAALTSPLHSAIRASLAQVEDRGKKRVHKVSPGVPVKHLQLPLHLFGRAVCSRLCKSMPALLPLQNLLTPQGRLDSRVVLGVLSSWAMDYNVLEGVVRSVCCGSKSLFVAIKRDDCAGAGAADSRGWHGHHI
jgi:hypothetical protein